MTISRTFVGITSKDFEGACHQANHRMLQEGGDGVWLANAKYTQVAVTAVYKPYNKTRGVVELCFDIAVDAELLEG